MNNRVALITGASSGIGRATAVAFARQDAKVVVASRRVEAGEKTVARVQEAGSEGIFVQTDVTQAVEVENLINQAVQAYGRIDYAFNNTGVEG